MRIFDYWTKVELPAPPNAVKPPGQRTSRKERISIHSAYGGSNVSIEDAQQDAMQRLANVAAKIAGSELSVESYEADIREIILTRLSERTIVTRNRYGAEVLNSEDVMFMDHDWIHRTLWECFFGAPNHTENKKRALNFIAKRYAKLDLAMQGIGMRLYETHKGIRVIVTGWKYGPKSKETSKLMREFRTDWLYSALCRKQGCYRARLTPKPSRMKYRTIKLKFPFPTSEAENFLLQWVKEYDEKRTKFATCRFVTTLGSSPSNPVIDYHDQHTGAFSGLKLA